MSKPASPPEAARQDGLFTVAQARAAGISSRRIRLLVADGRWSEVVAGVLTDDPRRLAPRHMLQAAVLTTGGVASHASAAVMWGWPTPAGMSHEVHVTMGVADHPRIPGVHLHRRPLGRGDRSWLYGMALTSRPRTLVDCAATWPSDAAAELLDHVLRTRLMRVDQVQSLTDAAKGIHGVRQLRRLVEQARAGTWSAAERLLHDLLRSDKILGWTANHRVELPRGMRAVVDVWFPAARLAVEIDGQAWHTTPERFQRDRDRQNALVLAGCTVLRFTWTDLTMAPDGVIRAIRSALAQPTGR